MLPSPQWSFPPFRLAPDNACLWRDAERLGLRPKTLGVLLHLVRHGIFVCRVYRGIERLSVVVSPAGSKASRQHR